MKGMRHFHLKEDQSMYFALKVFLSNIHNYSHENYVLASKDKSYLESIGNNFKILDRNINFEVEEIASENTRYVSSSYSDYDFACSSDQGLGLEPKEIDKLELKSSKESPENNVCIIHIEIQDKVPKSQLEGLYIEFTSTIEPLIFLEGYEIKKKAKETGEYYYNPSLYDTYKGVDIPMSDDTYMPNR